MKKKFYCTSLLVGFVLTLITALITRAVGGFLTTPADGAYGHATGLEYILPLLLMLLLSEVVMLIFALVFRSKHKNDGLKGSTVFAAFLIENLAYLILAPLLMYFITSLF